MRSETVERQGTSRRARANALRRWTLGLLALAVFGLTAFAGPAGEALAQFPLTTTPTPDRRVLNEIVSPRSNDAVAGLAAIVGTALVHDYIRYEVHVSPSGMENWQWLETSFAVVRDGVLAVWNTFLFPDGFYDIRVRAINRDGNYSEAFSRRVEVRNANPPTPTPRFDLAGAQQPPSPILFTSPLFPTATPAPRFLSFVPNGQGIFEPANGAVLRGVAPILGTVNSKTAYNPFQRYELHLAPSGTDEWGWLYTGQEQHWQDTLYDFDTTRLADGFYDLRLRVVYRDSNYDEYYVHRLRIANGKTTAQLAQQQQLSNAGNAPGLYTPRNGTRVVGVVDFVGTTDVPELLRWELYYAPAGQESWEFLVSGDQAIDDGILARLDLSLLPAGAYDFRLRIVRQNYGYSDYYVRGIESSPPTPTPFPTLAR
jgi:hypothetical protein